jgi:hypothetical protein
MRNFALLREVELEFTLFCPEFLDLDLLALLVLAGAQG